MGLRSFNNDKSSFNDVFGGTGYLYGPNLFQGDRGLFGGRAVGSTTIYDVIDYFAFATTGNSTDFGDLTDAVAASAGMSNGSRGVWGGGRDPSPTNIIQYITIATTGNATDFGDLTAARQACNAGVAGSGRGIIQGGYIPSANTNVIEYITIETPGNGTDFGDLTSIKTNVAGSGDGTYGLCAGGHDGSNYINVIEYITIATTGNGTDFGDLTGVRYAAAGAPHPTRATFFGGYTDTPSGQYLNTIDYVEIATPGNAIDFGDMTTTSGWVGANGNDTRAVRGGGEPNTDTKDYVTVASPGNATDFGDLTVVGWGPSGLSGD